MHRQQALLETKQRQTAALAQARREIEAAGGAIVEARTAPVDAPTVPVPRARASLNGNGLYISGPDHGRELQARAEAQEAAEAAKVARAAACWTPERREAVAKAEELLAGECEGSVERLAGQTGGVTHLRNLIWSRTARGPKAKNNKENALLTEAIAACETCGYTKCPPVDKDAPELGEAGGGGTGGEEAGGDAMETDGDALEGAEAEEGEDMED